MAYIYQRGSTRLTATIFNKPYFDELDVLGDVGAGVSGDGNLLQSGYDFLAGVARMYDMHHKSFMIKF
jgi:hypothetical protein